MTAPSSWWTSPASGRSGLDDPALRVDDVPDWFRVVHAVFFLQRVDDAVSVRDDDEACDVG